MTSIIPFRPHPVTPEIGVLASFSNGVSVLLEADRNEYEVKDEESELHYFDCIEDLTIYLIGKGCFKAGEKKST